MSGSVLGDIFKISTWGESHGKALGVVIDGCPAGLKISEADIQKDFLYMPDLAAAQEAEAYLSRLIEENNSSGGTIECRVKNIPQGLGDPVFDKSDALLTRAIMSIGAVKGVEVGSGFKAAWYDRS